MKKKFNIIIIIANAIIIFISALTQAQQSKWTHYFGHNQVTALAVKGDTLWIGYDYGLEERIISTEKYKLYFSYNSGLIYNYINSILVDQTGNKWLSLKNLRPYYEYNDKHGLVKFDGTTWSLYSSTESGDPVWANNIAIDSYENIWMAGPNSNLLKFDGRHWTIYSGKDQNFAWYSDTYSFAIDKKGNKWIGIADALIKFDGTSWYRLSLSNDYSRSSSVKDHLLINYIAFDSKDNLWTGTNNSGLGKYDGVKWTWFNIVNSPIPGNGITSLYVDKNDNVWLGCANDYYYFSQIRSESTKGLLKFDGSNWTVYNKTNSGLPSDFVTTITGDDYGNVWIGTYDVGFVKFNGKEWKVYNSSNSTLPVRNITSIITDPKGNKWFCSEGGLAELEENTWKFYSKYNSGLQSNVTYTIAFDSSYTKWIGTDSGLVKYDNKNWTVYNTMNSGLREDFVSAIAVDHKGVKWMGNGRYPITVNPYGGLTRFDGSSWSIYNTDNSPLPTNLISIIKIDSLGNKWIVYKDQEEGAPAFPLVLYGLFKFDDTSWKNYLDYAGMPILAAEFDKEGKLWVGGKYFGLTVFDGKKWTDHHTKNSGLPVNYVTAIAADSNGYVWIGTQNGLAVTDGKNWQVYDTSNSELRSNEILSLASDGSNRLWIAAKDNFVSSFQLERGIFTTVAKSQFQVEDYALLQNYPNPFNPVTTITYSIPKQSYVDLKIYDMLGREISTLVNKEQSAGEYKVQFNDTSLPSGIYIYSIRAGDYRASRKLMILK